MTLATNGLQNAVPYKWTYADATARTGATGFSAADVGSWAVQLSDGTVWELTATTPTWAQRGGGSGLTNPMTTAGDLIVGGASGAPTRLAAGTNTNVLTMVSGAPAWAAAAGGGAWTQLAVVTVSGSAAASVTVPASGSISGSYRALHVEWMVPNLGTTEDALYLQMNADTGANYTYAGQYMQESGGTTVYDGLSQTNLYIANLTGSAATTDSTTSGEIRIADYASTTRRKNVRATAAQVQQDATSPYFRRFDMGGVWKSDAAITSLKFLCGTANIPVGAWFALYGLT